MTGLALVLLALVPASSSAGVIAMTDRGLVVDTSADTDDYVIVVRPDVRSPEGNISRWEILALGCARPPGVSCLAVAQGSGEACRAAGFGEEGFGLGTVRCDRTAAGVTVRSGSGKDTVRLVTDGDNVSASLGGGNDVLTTVFTDEPTPLPTGTWVVDAGGGNDDVYSSSGRSAITGGSGNDRLRGFPLGIRDGESVEVPGDSGNDTINGGGGNDRINGGDGEDQLLGAGGDDRFGMRGEGTGGDAVDGGTGFDLIDYSQRTANLFFNSGATESGSPGARDRVSRMEHVIFGSGNDVAFSVVLGSGENLARRRYEGRSGNDDLRGGASNDTIIGGAGRDRLQGGSGNDLLNARDNARDERISCGPGSDRAELDPEDPDPDPPSACETIRRR